MSQQFLIRRDGHARTPGPDPHPSRRISTEQKATPSSNKDHRPRRRKRCGRCGSQKSKRALAKALINLIIRQGLIDLQEEGSEPPESANARQLQSTLEQRIMNDLQIPVSVPDDERYMMVRFELGDGGREQAIYRDTLTGKELSESELPTLQHPSLGEIAARNKIRSALQSLKEIKISFRLGDIARYAVSDPKVARLLERYDPKPNPKVTVPHQVKKPITCSHGKVQRQKKKLH